MFPDCAWCAQGNTSADSLTLKAALEPFVAIEYIEPNFIYRAHAVPNDPEYATRQWALNNTGQTGSSLPFFPDIRAELAWDITTGAEDLVVAVIDTGVDYLHEDLAANIFRNEEECDADGVDDDTNGYVDDCHGIDTSDHDSDPMDGEQHGTHVAGIIGAVGNNGIGITGVAWQVEILACRFLDSNGSGTTAGAIECLDYIAAMKDRGVNLVASNNSWGSFEDSRALEEAIRSQRQRGILFVAAAGNVSHDVDLMPHYPCAHDVSNVICVGAAYDSSEYWSSGGYGTVHLAAPGGNIYSTVPGNRYDWKDGTSMATPHVSGALVLLKQQVRSRDWRALKNLVMAGAVPPQERFIRSITDGRLDLSRSMNCPDSVVLARLRPHTFERLLRPIGGQVGIRALHIRCEVPNGNVVVNVAPTGEAVTLRDDGMNGDDLAGDGEYAGSWTVQTADTFSFTFPAPETETFSVLVDEHLEAGFPISTDLRTFEDQTIYVVSGDMVVGNIDADPELEILSFPPAAGPLHAWNHDGTAIPGWPVYPNGEAGGLALGELDGDPTHDEVAAYFRFSDVVLLGGAGQEFARLPAYPVGIYQPPLLADLDGDGLHDVVGVAAYRVDGTLIGNGLPVPVLPEPGQGQGFLASLTVGDLDADGVLELVGTSNDSGANTWLWVTDANGRHDGFPTLIPDSRYAPGYHSVIGDVDGDGVPEIVLNSTANPSGPGASPYARIQILGSRGELKRTINSVGWPSSVASLADLDADGIPEIVMATYSHLFVWNGKGAALSGWPVMPPSGNFAIDQPAVGDVDGDGQVDIVLTGYADNLQGPLQLYAFRGDGTPIPGFPKSVDTGPLTHPVGIADIDRDGRNEIIVVQAGALGMRQSVFVYDLHGPGPYGPIEWQQKSGSAQRTGYYETGKNLPNHAYVATQVFGAGSIVSADGGINCGSDCIERFTKGTQVTLTAGAHPGGTFGRWRGACAGQGNPCTLNVQRFSETSADFASRMQLEVTGNGVVTSVPSGINCPGDCDEMFLARDMITLTATENAASDFTGWSGACSGTQETCKVFIDDAKNVGANFVNDYPVTVSKSGGGSAVVTSSVAGIDCGADCAADFPVRSIVRITIAPAADTRLVSWHRLGCLDYQLTCEFAMNGPVALNIELALKPVMTVTIVGDGRLVVQPGGECATSSCRIPVDIGQVMLTAIPDPGGEFLGFAGLCAGQGNLPNCNHYMVSDLLVRAVFAEIPRLTLDFQGAGSGTVRGPAAQECTTDCEFRIATPQVISLTATVGSNSVFGGWSGACTGTAATCEVPFMANTTVGVTFNVAPPPPPPPPSPPPSNGGKGGGGSFSLLELSILALVLAWTLSRRACRANRAASRTRPVPSRPCKSNPRGGCRTSRVDRSRARC